MRFLIFGDIVGKIGRRALIKEIQNIKDKYNPDFVIANAENLAHGNGITEKTLREMREAGINCFTGGNHTFSKQPGLESLKEIDVIRPANYPIGTPGFGYRNYSVADKTIIVLNLQGEVFMKEFIESPFTAAKTMLDSDDFKKTNIILVDFHAEATSEKIGLALFLDGKVSLIWGTHTHVQTNDARVLRRGTGYITDAGMVGDKNGILGVKHDIILHNFLNPEDKKTHDFEEAGEAIISGIVTDIDNETGKCAQIEPFNIFTTI